MKKLLIASVIAFATFSTQAKDLTFAMEPSYPPFETTNEKGEIIGFDVDIANAICKEIQANCSFKSLSFDGLVQAVKQKRIDGVISAMDITEARSKQVLFSDAYYDSSASFIALKSKADLNTAKKRRRTKWDNFPTICCSRSKNNMLLKRITQFKIQS